ncbi:MAG TPA: hypothetical protein VIQ00_01075, partial [Chitinophagaceae bacterium]
MRNLLSIAFTLLFFCVNAQTKTDSITTIDKALHLVDLDFTNTEIDSMLDGVQDNYNVYKTMHQYYP